MVRDASGAILNPGWQILKAGAQFMQPGAKYSSQRRNTGVPQGQDFLTMLSLVSI